jgi:hypothetical protein
MISRISRRILIGSVAGGLASLVLVSMLHHILLSFLLGTALALAYAIVVPPSREAYVDRLMSGAAMGIPLWGLISVIAIPVVSGEMPEWSAEQMRVHVPALVGWVLYGACLSVVMKACGALAIVFLGAETEPQTHGTEETTRILILGGGGSPVCEPHYAWRSSSEMTTQSRSR